MRKAEEAVRARALSPVAQWKLGRALQRASMVGRAYSRYQAASFLAEDSAPGIRVPDGFRKQVNRDLARALRDGESERAPAPTHKARVGEERRRVRRLRRALAEARSQFEGGEYDKALRGFEEVREDVDAGAAAREVDSLIASCHLRLGVLAARENDHRGAVEHLYVAADLDASLRQPGLYRDIGRLQRRVGLRAASDGRDADATVAFLSAFGAFADDPETLFLLSRAPGTGPGALGSRVTTYFQELLRRRHPRRAESSYYVAVERCRNARDVDAALAEVDRYVRAYPRARVLAADLRQKVLERRRGEAAKAAEDARKEYERLLEEAKEARLLLEDEMEPAGSEGAGEMGPAAPEDDRNSGDQSE
ncbi:hypothetical protein ACFL59_08735 [Planctomycetota bacterium]